MKTINKKVLFILTAIVLISLFSVIAVNAESTNTTYVAKSYIDYPAGDSLGGNIIVDGWVMTNDTQATVKVYIDNAEAKIISQTRKNRPDVLNAIKGYGTSEQNKQPGIRYTLNCSNLSTGKHTISFKVISRENKVISEYKDTFTYENEKAAIYIDSPLDKNNVISGNYRLDGWVMSNDAKATIKIYLNDQEQSQDQIKRVARPDVLKAIKGYGTKIENPNPGFQYTINCANYTDGTYTLKVVVLSEEGKTLTHYTKNIVIQKYKAKTYIDYPAGDSLGGNIVVDGWMMTNDSEAKLKVYIDGSEAEILSQTRRDRGDVLNAIKDCGTTEQNKQPGIRYTLNCSKLSTGKHKITFKVISRENKVIAEYTDSFTYENEKASVYIDSPLDQSNVISGNYKLEGWVMSNDAKATIKIYLNDQEQSQDQIKRVARPDVLKAIKGYGTKIENPNPGFQYTINCANYTDGTYTLKVVVLSEEGKTLTHYTKNIVIQKYKAKSYIDYPINNLAGNFEFEGWILTNDEKSTYKLYVDNAEQKNVEFQRLSRPDVQNAYKEFGTSGLNQLPGLKCNINTSNIKTGKHSITLKVFSREGKVISEFTTNFTLEESKAKLYIDKPADTNKDIVNKNVKVEGWLMSNDKNANIKVYIDGKEQKANNFTRIKRDDVLDAIKDYGSKTENPKPGFEFNLDLSGFSDGEHSIKIEAYSGAGKKLTTQEQKFTLEKYPIKMWIEDPTNNLQVSTTMRVKGWLMSTGTNSSIKIYVDNKPINNIQIKRQVRPDVINAIKGYGTIKENPTPGFDATLDTSKLTDGKHILKIVALINNEETKTIDTRSFTVKKYKTSTYIDEPAQNSIRGDKLTISGWAMSQLANKKVIVKIDDKEVGNVTYKTREDVIQKISGYGTIKENPTPGFSTTVDISSFSKGTHTIKIQVYSNETNEVIHEQTQNIVFLGKIEREVITYGYSGAYLKGISGGSELQCYKFGDGPNVLFATFCVHGYEDSWDRDGEILVKTANDFYNRLLQDQDYSLAEKWTVYIFPEVNPDGRRLGTTKNGPGRTTLYSMVGKGIDINRSWQTGSNYERFTSDRNYNGTEGFQAYEAKYLRDFILTHKTNNGQNVLIDFHGWENQLIGDESVCKYYKEQYPSCRTTGYGRYGSQYIISWARLNIGAKVALVELPLANSMAEALSMKLPEKYINATLNLLRGM